MPTRLWFASAAAAVAALAGLWLARAPAISAPDVEQPRLSQPAPVPVPPHSLHQTFRPQHDGLSSVEVLAVHFGEPAAGTAELTLRLWGPDEALLGQTTQRAFEHNAALRLSFPPVPDSAGKLYRLEVSGTEAAQTTVWAYPLDGYQAGDLRLGAEAAAGDLRFTTTYTYLWPDMARDAAAALWLLARLALPLWLVGFVPGLLMLDALRPGVFETTRWTRWGAALALSLSLLPLAWLWHAQTGLRWTTTALAAVYAVLGAVAAGRWLRFMLRATLRRRLRAQVVAFPGSQPVPVRFAGPAAQPRWSRHDGAMGLLLLLSLLVRLMAVRDLALPAWVDSSHHAFVARVLAENGRVPEGYGPLLEAGAFTYHFGVHAVLVTLDWFSPLDLPATMLAAGQVLNGLMPLAVYAAAAAMRRRRAGLLAAAFVGLVSFFPGYYATWGRYSQLAGLLLLVPGLAAVWALVQAPTPLATESGSHRQPWPWRPALCAGVLAAGLALTHYRVLLFFVLFAAAAALLHARHWRYVMRGLGLATAIGGLLAAPWLVRLFVEQVLPLLEQPSRLGSAASYNSFPWGYFAGGLERGALALAAAAGAWALLKRERLVATLVLWVAIIFALLNLGVTTWLINNNAWAISLFVPQALLLGWGLDQWLTRARHLLAAAPTLHGPLPDWHRRARAVAGIGLVAAAAGLAAYAAAAGLRAQLAIINPVTVLARVEDRVALDWVVANTPEDALFAINGWQWLGASWAGADGGAWVMPYAGRRATLPPVTYAFGNREAFGSIHEQARAIFGLQTDAAEAALAQLRATGATHIFIGAKGGSLRPEMFVNSPDYRLLYTNGAAWVFEIVENEGG